MNEFRWNLRSLSPSHLSSVVSSSLPSPTHFSSLDVKAATDTLCSTLTSCLDDICHLSSRPARAAPSKPLLNATHFLLPPIFFLTWKDTTPSKSSPHQCSNCLNLVLYFPPDWLSPIKDEYVAKITPFFTLPLCFDEIFPYLNWKRDRKFIFYSKCTNILICWLRST